MEVARHGQRSRIVACTVELRGHRSRHQTRISLCALALSRFAFFDGFKLANEAPGPLARVAAANMLKGIVVKTLAVVFAELQCVFDCAGGLGNVPWINPHTTRPEALRGAGKLGQNQNTMSLTLAGRTRACAACAGACWL